MIKPTSFQADIRPLFTDLDVHAMSKAFNLASYDEYSCFFSGERRFSERSEIASNARFKCCA